MLKSQTIAKAWRASPVSRVEPADVILVTDFDGTLADIVPDPSRAEARPEALEALSRLTGLLADVIVLSSRTPDDLQERIQILDLRLIGDSGLALPRHAHRRALDQFNHDVSKVLARTPGASLEEKPASSAVHFRNADMSGEEMLALLKPLLDGGRLAASLGRKVIEVHVPNAGKGSALAALLPAEDPGGVVCFGDDENDRSMFEYVGRLDIPHLCVGVDSPEAPKDLFGRCDLVLCGPPEVALLLGQIVEWAEG